MRPGQCWAFKGDQGYLVIKLTGHVQPTSFSLEHLPKNLSPTGKIDSALRDFEVYVSKNVFGGFFITRKE
jgi:SUN domain-containing protein 1/2